MGAAISINDALLSWYGDFVGKKRNCGEKLLCAYFGPFGSSEIRKPSMILKWQAK